MSLWLFCTIAAVLFLAAIGLLYFGLWGDRSKGRLRCPKCWYDMTGSFEAGKLVCPECGMDASVEKRLKKNHRRWWAILPSLPVVLAGLLVGLPSFFFWYGWHSEQAAITAIEKLSGEVHRESIVSVPPSSSRSEPSVSGNQADQLRPSPHESAVSINASRHISRAIRAP